ncbi:iron ABC transporter substrate-binding protein [Aggregatibacter kilianii]|uniref:iron ABC transporter substrate-binding protein n=1 Tax=Aggregatibacter kilianii TaxID=2025884 RepID=UPI000D65DED1|nr:iron ABC transporter substrate-binding protein [Aggregatibacter kilianii]
MKKWIMLFFLLFTANLWAEERPVFFLAGELPTPQRIEKVLSAGNPSDVLLLSVAPQKMVGLAGFNMASQGGKLFPAEQQTLPTIGKIAGKGSTLSAEKIVALQPNLIIDAGNVTPNYIDQAKRTFAQTGVPYLLLDGRLAETPNTLRELGKLLGEEKTTEEQAQYAEETLKSAVVFAGVLQPTAYLARSADGLQTGQKGSIHTEAMELVGLRNVVEGEHKGLTQVSMEQLLLWDPDIILTQYAEFFQTIKDNPQWQQLSAVKNQRVFFIPNQPFGWLDSPPSLNRLLGVRWLQHLLSNKPIADFVPEVQRFYQLFYHIELSNAQAEQLLKQGK